MEKQIRCGSSFVWIVLFHVLLFNAETFAANGPLRNNLLFNQNHASSPVQLRKIDNDHVTVDNGIVNVTFSIGGGMVTGIEYNGIKNLLETDYEEDERGYWDVVWSRPGHPDDVFDKLGNARYEVIVQNDNQVELSFSRTSDGKGVGPALNADKRYVVLRGSSGFYSYAIFERLQGFTAETLYQGRMVFKLQDKLFRYMAISDNIQRIMPTMNDRKAGKALDYPEAVLLTNPADPSLKGEVDDKYQYSTDNKDSKVHGWVSPNPLTGFWMITPSNEFKTAGPVKQDITSHAGPITLSMFWSTHYAGETLGIKFEDGEPWKKVFGPVFCYVNSGSQGNGPSSLWRDAKNQMLTESGNWPYEFPQSKEHLRASQRGTVSGQLLVKDGGNSVNANAAFVGLAPPGLPGSWQWEVKDYQFWAQTDSKGSFSIPNVRPGKYNLYAWVPGFIGDFKHNVDINIAPGSKIALGSLTYIPPRNGPTLWEIGVPDRSAAEFFSPSPSPNLMNKLFVHNTDKYRQYGLWQRYSEIYPKEDLMFTVGRDDHTKNWFYAHVNRKTGNTYVPTTWRIVFNVDNVDSSGNYTLQVALAAANEAELQIRINDVNARTPHFTTMLIGKDNAIARHGIHGLYWMYSVGIPPSKLVKGSNTIFLTQSRGVSPWRGIMYDYLRLESPSPGRKTQ